MDAVEIEAAANDPDFLKNVELSLSIGMPAPRILFNSMIQCAKATEAVKDGWRQTLEQELAVQATGCIKIEFQSAGVQKTAYLMLDECGADHDLTAELDKIYSQIPDARQEEVRHHLGALIYLGRSVYEMIISKSQIIKDISAAIQIPGETFDYRNLKIDVSNTTLFLLREGRRVGIYVRFAE